MTLLALILAIDLNLLAQVESGGRAWAIGDHGKAHGLFQMHAGAWSDVNRARAKRGAAQYNFSFAHNPTISREYAGEYLGILTNNFAVTRGHYPTAQQTYALWSLGLEGFKRRGFSMSKAPVKIKKSARKFK